MKEKHGTKHVWGHLPKLTEFGDGVTHWRHV